MKQYLKPLIGALIAGIGTFSAAYATDHQVTVTNVLAAIVSLLAAFNGVYFTPYAPAPNATPPQPPAPPAA